MADSVSAWPVWGIWPCAWLALREPSPGASRTGPLRVFGRAHGSGARKSALGGNALRHHDYFGAGAAERACTRPIRRRRPQKQLRQRPRERIHPLSSRGTRRARQVYGPCAGGRAARHARGLQAPPARENGRSGATFLQLRRAAVGSRSRMIHRKLLGSRIFSSDSAGRPSGCARETGATGRWTR